MALRGYRARWIVDGIGGPTHPGVVLIDDERIVDVVGPNSAPSDAEITDLGEAAILPGLIDAHVHLIWAGAKPNPDISRIAVHHQAPTHGGSKEAHMVVIGHSDEGAIGLRGLTQPETRCAGRPLTDPQAA